MVWLTGATHKNNIDRFSPAQRSLSAALLAGLGGMAADNIFGNVSLFFAVPGFLFSWDLGQWAALHGQGEYIPVPALPRRLFSGGRLL